MREIEATEIERNIYELCVKANTQIRSDVKKGLEKAYESEVSDTGAETLRTMLRNIDLAEMKHLPICQDTGMVIVFLDIGQDVHITGDYVGDAINRGVSRAYQENYFRKSIVWDPIDRINTKTNTPAIIHTRIIPGDNIWITLMAKGFGSENTSALAMLNPSDGIEGVKAFVQETIEKAIPNGCAPLVVGVGIGGDFETAAINAKRALIRPLKVHNPKKVYRDLERDLLLFANNTGIGPMGTGGIHSVLDVHVLEAPTHIAGLPVAVNICCYVDRVVGRKI